MSSLPTSLILVALAAAWLVVLVPMVSRRREQVPESDEETASFRVLDRRDRSGAERPVLSRTAMAHRSRGQSEDYDDDRSGDSGDGRDADRVAAQRGASAVYDDPRERAGADVIAGAGTDSYRADYRADEVAARGRRRGDDTVAASAETDDDGGTGRGSRHNVVRDAADDWRAEQEQMRYQRVDERVDADRRRAPMRAGRGGFDPVAADQARAYRFRQRRRTASALLLLTLLGAGVGAVGIGYGYVAAAVAGPLLVLYFAYLRRQVRIEESIRVRRAARLERARQIRPGYRPSVAEQVWMHRTGEIPRPGSVDPAAYAVRSHVRQTVPPAGLGRGTLVDVEDSDPIFDDLEYYRPVEYRRRAG